MKRTLELVSFVSFVTFVMWIVLSDVAPVKKRSADKTADLRSSQVVFLSDNVSLLKDNLKTSK